MWWFRTLARPCTHSSREILKRLVSVINRNLRGRCPRTRVGLPVPFPKGKEPYSLMVDVDTFLTILYVMVDDFCHSPHKQSSTPDPMLRSVLARSSPSPSSPDGLASVANGTSTAMQTPACEMPFLPCPIVRNSTALCATTSISHRGSSLAPGGGDVKAQRCSYEALDSSAMPVRDAKRRGEGWLAGFADIGWSNSLGWYEGFRLLWLSILRVSSRVLASVLLRPPTSR